MLYQRKYKPRTGNAASRPPVKNLGALASKAASQQRTKPMTAMQENIHWQVRAEVDGLLKTPIPESGKIFD